MLGPRKNLDVFILFIIKFLIPHFVERKKMATFKNIMIVQLLLGV